MCRRPRPVPSLRARTRRESGLSTGAGRVDLRCAQVKEHYIHLHRRQLGFGRNTCTGDRCLLMAPPGASLRRGTALREHGSRGIGFTNHVLAGTPQPPHKDERHQDENSGDGARRADTLARESENVRLPDPVHAEQDEQERAEGGCGGETAEQLVVGFGYRGTRPSPESNTRARVRPKTAPATSTDSRGAAVVQRPITLR